MKSIIMLLFFSLTFMSVSYSQSLTERELFSSSTDDNVQSFNFIYNERTGTYCYLQSDPETFKTKIISPYGESKLYDYASTFYIKFDEKGNYYTITFNYYQEGMYDSVIYYLIMNGDEINTLEYAEVYDSYVNPNDEFEFISRVGDDFIIMRYSPSTGPVSSGNYSSIKTAYKFYTPDMVGDEDFYFRDNSGHRYYIARKNEKAYLLVNGNEIETNYSDIENSSLTYDKYGGLVYIGKTTGVFWEDYGYELVVQGDKTYDQFGRVYSPVMFTETNEPVYVIGERMEDGENFISRLIVGNEIKDAYTDATRTKKVEDFTAGIYNLEVEPDGNISYFGSVRINWDFYDYTKVYSKTTRVFNDVAEGFYNDLGTFKSSMTGDELFTYNSTDESGKSVLALKSGSQAGEVKIVSDERFSFISDFGFTPDNKVYYVGVIPGDYELKIKDRYTIVIDGIEIGTYPSLLFTELADNSYSYLTFDNTGNYAYATYDFIDTSSNSDEWFSVSYVMTNNGVIIPQILPMPGRAFFNSVDRLMYIDNGQLFYIGTIFDASNPYLSYYQFNINEQPFREIYNNYDRFVYDQLLNRMKFLSVRDNKIFEVTIAP